jgi:hypothetical protein
MWVNEGLAVLNSLFPKLVLYVNHGEGNEWTAKKLHQLSLEHAPMNDRAAIISTADRLGLWVHHTGNVYHR